MKKLLIVLTILSSNLTLFSQFDHVWTLISQNNYTAAIDELKILSEQPETAVDAGALGIMISELGMKVDGNLQLMKNLVANTDTPSPYLFSLYRSSGLTNDFDLDNPERKKFIEDLLKSPKVNESMKTSFHYVLAYHSTFAYEDAERLSHYNSMSAITDWQFTGLFDNTSGSGHNKSYGPLAHPEPEAVFYSKKNAEIAWFTPGYTDFDPWNIFRTMLPGSQGVVYAQTFLDNPTEQEVLLSAGAEGAIKIWVNDLLVLDIEEEQRTELDYYNSLLTLPAGKNRVLVQISFTNMSSYPNFMVRLLNQDTYKPINNIKSTTEYAKYNSVSDTKFSNFVPHFGETYFEEKIKLDSTNIIDYLLLSKCYSRAKKNNEAIKVLELGKKIDPSNVLLNLELINNYSKLNDRTALLFQLEDMRQINPNLLFLKIYDYNIAKENQNYDLANTLLLDLKSELGEKSIEYLDYQIDMRSAKSEYQELFDLIDQAYSLYPNVAKFAELKYLLEKNQTQSVKKSLPILKKYLKSEYNYSLMLLLAKEYQEIGENDKVVKLLEGNMKRFPDHISVLKELLRIDYNQLNYTDALAIINKMISISPYTAGYYSDRAYINLALNNYDLAKADFKRTIQLEPNTFEAREKLRSLEEKESWTKIMENKDAYDIIKKSFEEEIDSDDQYDFIFYENSTVKFEEGAGVEFTSIGIRILNKSGIDAWKELSIPYNYNSEELLISKAELNKKNGQKLEGERNYNDIVFPSLEVGDIIYLEFRKDVYTGGKLAKEISETYNFSRFAPTHNSLYRIYVPKSYNIEIKEQNLLAEKKVFEFENYVCTEYTHDFIEKIKDEDFMPQISEIGQTIYITTYDSWDRISDWYSDLAMPMAKEGYNIDEVYNEIFKADEDYTDQEKAEKIYDYLCENINYSSVSFRQSNLVPQKPMVTISTKLGDCKDLSTLFYTLAKKADLKSELVLVNTRANGENTMQFPSTQFNHCIVKVDIDGEPLFQELTDSKLPFGSMPTYLYNSQALVIPATNAKLDKNDLIHIPLTRLTENNIKRDVKVNITDDGMTLNTKVDLTGSNISNYRWFLSDLTKVETKEKIDDYCSDYFSSDFKVNNFEISHLEGNKNDFSLEIDLTLEDEIKSIGALKTFAVPFFEKIFTIDKFPSDDRVYPLNYWEYEEVNNYSTDIYLTIDEEFEFAEIPANVMIKNKFIHFEIIVEKVNNNELKITRKVAPVAHTIATEDYAEFRKMAKEISNTEEVFVAYKKKS